MFVPILRLEKCSKNDNRLKWGNLCTSNHWTEMLQCVAFVEVYLNLMWKECIVYVYFVSPRMCSVLDFFVLASLLTDTRIINESSGKLTLLKSRTYKTHYFHFYLACTSTRAKLATTNFLNYSFEVCSDTLDSFLIQQLGCVSAFQH